MKYESCIIGLKNVTKDFSIANRKKNTNLKENHEDLAVSDVNLNIYKGEIFVLIGSSGSGKSTLLRMINNLVIPTKGEVLIEGRNTQKMSHNEMLTIRQKKISMVFQSISLLPHRTVISNIEFGLEVQGVKKSLRIKKAKESLHLVGLNGYEYHYPHQLSGGMQQRVGLARAIANDTDIILMDEAFSALDPIIRRDLQNQLLDLQSKLSKTIVFITHDIDEALKIGDRIGVMSQGKVIQVGKPEEILLEPFNEYVKNLTNNINLQKLISASFFHSLTSEAKEKLIKKYNTQIEKLLETVK
ncbi:betaine/proline/choline family ABC transporter ATP-binding protein [Cytobacillus horneckiae]|uniref:betaine/proline/choline family ABC transporter ATP-binding protein n=1 Tax=Cytobacillus horneckiae TaxID=549687 RepID=UPI003D9A0E3C